MTSKPKVDAQLRQMNGLQRAAESFRYVVLSIEWWISPNGAIREWLRQTTRVAIWFLIPTIVVMPLVTLILWQLTVWLAMLTNVLGRLIVLPILLLLAMVSFSIVLRIIAAFRQR